MSEHTDGGPAFPVPYSNEADGPTVMPTVGMSLRDYFAAKAMLGILAGNHPIVKDPKPLPVIADVAYRMADAMLAERAKGEAMSEHNDEFAAIREALADFDANPDSEPHAMRLMLRCRPTLIARLLAAADRAKELEADARRYRWLRQNNGMFYRSGNGADALRVALSHFDQTTDLWVHCNDGLDAAIDRAQGAAT